MDNSALFAGITEGYPWNLLKTDWGDTTHVVVSDLRQDELADLMKLDPDSIHVIPNGVEMDRFYKLETLTQEFINNACTQRFANSAFARTHHTAQKY